MKKTMIDHGPFPLIPESTVMTKRDDLAMPKGLGPRGKQAWELITSLLKGKGRTYTGGCKAFYSPEEWEERGEEYGQDSRLIVVYDGGDLMPFFNMDHAAPKYTLYEEMRSTLEANGYYFEECTNWYAAVYDKG